MKQNDPVVKKKKNNSTRNFDSNKTQREPPKMKNEKKEVTTNNEIRMKLPQIRTKFTEKTKNHLNRMNDLDEDDIHTPVSQMIHVDLNNPPPAPKKKRMEPKHHREMSLSPKKLDFLMKDDQIEDEEDKDIKNVNNNNNKTKKS